MLNLSYNVKPMIQCYSCWSVAPALKKIRKDDLGATVPFTEKKRVCCAQKRALVFGLNSLFNSVKTMSTIKMFMQFTSDNRLFT